MRQTLQAARWDEDTSALRTVAELLRRSHPAEPDGSNLQSRSLLARLAFRGMLEEGRSAEEIADAFGLDAEQVRQLTRTTHGS